MKTRDILEMLVRFRKIKAKEKRAKKAVAGAESTKTANKIVSFDMNKIGLCIQDQMKSKGRNIEQSKAIMKETKMVQFR